MIIIITYQSTNKFTIQSILGNHLHLLNHEKIQRLARTFDGKNSICHHTRQMICQLYINQPIPK